MEGKVVKSFEECLRDAEGNAPELLDESAAGFWKKMHGNVLPDSVPASVVIRRGFRGMQEGDVPRVPLPPSLLSLSFPPPSGNLPCIVILLQMKKRPPFFGNKCIVLLQDLSVIYNR